MCVFGSIQIVLRTCSAVNPKHETTRPGNLRENVRRRFRRAPVLFSLRQKSTSPSCLPGDRLFAYRLPAIVVHVLRIVSSFHTTVRTRFWTTYEMDGRWVQIRTGQLVAAYLERLSAGKRREIISVYAKQLSKTNSPISSRGDHQWPAAT